jgi:hypothetical protein
VAEMLFEDWPYSVQPTIFRFDLQIILENKIKEKKYMTLLEKTKNLEAIR